MKIVVLIATIVCAFLIFYIGMPIFAFGFIGWTITLVLLIFLFGINFVDFENGLPSWLSKFWIVSGIVVLLFLIAIPTITTWSAFRADSYKNIIGKPIKSDISSDLNPINPENIVIIDEVTAERLGEKKLTETNSALGSEVELGKFTLQKVKDKLYYVAPLLHSGFFKWFGNSYTSGYIIVNALNDKDIKLVQEVNGKKIKIKYQPNAYFGDLLERKLYFNGFASKGLSDYSFEIDDEGNPFWCVTTYEKRVGYSGDDATGVVVVDPETGDYKQYGLNDAPKWVDRIQPLSFIEEQIGDWGEFVNGWINPSNKGKVKVTPGSSLVYGDDGICYFYIGLTSVGKDEASSGFFLVNSRTKEAKLYEMGGATETAAMGSAKGKWPEKRYEPTFPRPYNVDGHFTYIMALKDQEGLIKAVALVSYKNYEIVGIGSDLKSALRDYNSVLLGSGNALAPNSIGSCFEISDKVNRINKDIKQGETFYYIILKNNLNKMFRLSSSVSDEVVITEPGDSIKISFRDGGNSIIDVEKFYNKGFKFQKTKNQIGVEKYFKKVDDSLAKKQVDKDADVLLKNLSQREKEELLEKSRKK